MAKLNLYVWDFLFLSLPQGIVCQFWDTYLELKCLPRTEMGISGSICVQSHVLRYILDPIESLAVGPHMLPLNFLSSSPGPGRPPHYLHDESLGLCVALPAGAKALWPCFFPGHFDLGKRMLWISL